MRYLGQHFLKNKNIVKKIVDVAELNKSDVVLEVGPGKGILTEYLLNRVSQVIAVEKDKWLCELLNDKFNNEIKIGKLVLVEGDVLKIFRPTDGRLKGDNFKFPISKFSKNKSEKFQLQEKYKIVANIPYYITSRFLKIFLEEVKYQPEKMVLMVQKEVAERICEKPRLRQGYGGQAKKSLLALSVQVYGEPKIALKVSAGNFSPPPEVDSAVLVIDNISKKWFNGITEKDFFAVVKAGFARKRKFLLNNLSEGLKILKPEIENIFKECRIGLKTRAQELDLEEWKCITKIILNF